MVAEEHLTIR